MFKFSLKFDDDKHTLSASDGLSIDKLSELLNDLFDAINSGSGSKLTLGTIRGNCYALDFYTEDEKFHSNFIIVHKKIEQHTEIDLKDKERKYAKTLDFILGDKFYLQAFDNAGNEIVKIRAIDIKNEIRHYYNVDTISGIVSEIGGKDLATQPHIFISGEDYKVYVTNEQDLALKKFYKTETLRIRLRKKISLKDGHTISAKFLDFKTKGKKLIDNVNEIDVTNLNILNDINNNDDILRKLYGND